jgi:hypothetical protein
MKPVIFFVATCLLSSCSDDMLFIPSPAAGPQPLPVLQQDRSSGAGTSSTWVGGTLEPRTHGAAHAHNR